MPDAQYHTRENVIVSIFVLVYNQEKFIRQTLDSLLSQKTSFPFKIVIGDDASTDFTSSICEDYAVRFPQVIDYHRNQVNLGLMGNFVQTATRLKGKYIAICDGDDYWIDDEKLEKQVRFLEENPQYAVIGTGVQLLLNDGQTQEKAPAHLEEFSLTEMIADNKIVAPTTVFRNYKAVKSLPSWFKNMPYGDWPLYIMALQEYQGKACILPDLTAVYRLQTGESFKMRQTLSKVYKNNALILEHLRSEKSMQSINKELKDGWKAQKFKQVLALHNENQTGVAFMYFCKLSFLYPSLQRLKHYLYAVKKRL